MNYNRFEGFRLIVEQYLTNKKIETYYSLLLSLLFSLFNNINDGGYVIVYHNQLLFQEVLNGHQSICVERVDLYKTGISTLITFT
jgi:hypothetical protein